MLKLTKKYFAIEKLFIIRLNVSAESHLWSREITNSGSPLTLYEIHVILKLNRTNLHRSEAFFLILVYIMPQELLWDLHLNGGK